MNICDSNGSDSLRRSVGSFKNLKNPLNDMGILLGNSLLRMRNVDFEITGLGLMIPDD